MKRGDSSGGCRCFRLRRAWQSLSMSLLALWAVCLLSETFVIASNPTEVLEDAPTSTSPMMVVLPISDRKSEIVIDHSSRRLHRRRRRLFAERRAANFSLPLEGAIKDYGYAS